MWLGFTFEELYEFSWHMFISLGAGNSDRKLQLERPSITAGSTTRSTTARSSRRVRALCPWKLLKPRCYKTWKTKHFWPTVIGGLCLGQTWWRRQRILRQRWIFARKKGQGALKLWHSKAMQCSTHMIGFMTVIMFCFFVFQVGFVQKLNGLKCFCSELHCCLTRPCMFAFSFWGWEIKMHKLCNHWSIPFCEIHWYLEV